MRLLTLSTFIALFIVWIVRCLNSLPNPKFTRILIIYTRITSGLRSSNGFSSCVRLRSLPITEKVTKWVGAWNARRLSFITDREIRDEYLVTSFDIVARIKARRLTWAGHLLREKEEHLPRRVAVARLKSDLQERGSLRTTYGMFQDAPDHNTFEEPIGLENMAQSRRFWRCLVVAIEPRTHWNYKKGRRRGKQGAQKPLHWILTLLNGYM